LAGSETFPVATFDTPKTIRSGRLDDPRFILQSLREITSTSLNHLGLQVESDEDLAMITRLLDAGGRSIEKQEYAAYFYPRCNKG
jgi:hypothetical protein